MRVVRSAGYLTGKTYPYQEYILDGMHIFEENDDIRKHNQLVESLFAIIQPKAFEKWKKNKDFIRAEEGVDEVIYSGEDDWTQIMEDFESFGFQNIDPFGEGF